MSGYDGRVVLAVLSLLVAAAGVVDEAAYRREVEAWRRAREARLVAEGGWLSLAGLSWLKPGANRFGADPESGGVLPDGAPTHAGSFVLESGRVTVEVAPGVAVTLRGHPVTKAVLRSDAGGATPDVLTLGALTIQVIERHGRLAIRLKDQNSQARRTFTGIDHYPVRPEYRVVARFIPNPGPTTIRVPDVLGLTEDMPSPGHVEFELGGQKLRLDPVIESPGDTQLFFVFRDRTSGKTTYGAGRFLYAEAPADGHVILDFNKAYNPPCSFTPFATCPLPPPQNHLAVPVEAGERHVPHR